MFNVMFEISFLSDYLLRFLPLDPSVDGSKIGRVYTGASGRLQTVTVISILNQMSTGRAIDVELKAGILIQISISRASPWARLTFDLSKVEIHQ